MFGRKKQMPIPFHYAFPPGPNFFPPGWNGYGSNNRSQAYSPYQHPGYHPYMAGGGPVPHQNMPLAPYGPQAMGMNAWQGGGHPYAGTQNVSQMLFDNPLQPAQNTSPYGGFLPQGQQQYANLHPYPQQAFLPKQPSGFQTVMNSFKNQEGTLDVNKMLDTAGQMMNAVTQVSSMVKGLGGILKV
jgi:hypothetical protein